MNIYIINEHHEAFYIIRELYRNNNKCYSLINVDEHHDLGRAILNKSSLAKNDLKKDQYITYNDLRVSDFILPLIHVGIINKLFWINHQIYKSTVNLYTNEISNGENIIISSHFNDDSKGIPFNTTNIFNLNKNDFSNNDNIILSIDYDYFSSNNNDGEKTVIEITKEEYKNIKDNNYHKIRLNYGSQFNLLKCKNKYLLELNILDGDDLVHFRDNTTIKKMIDFLFISLKLKEINPSVIILCRSIFSKYTHKKSQKYIENQLIYSIKSNYPNCTICEV